MAIVGQMSKQPHEVLDYDIDFSEWLSTGDSITNAVADCTPTGELMVDSTSVNRQVVKVWLSGGTNAVRYKITVTVTSLDGRVKEAEFTVKVKEI